MIEIGHENISERFNFASDDIALSLGNKCLTLSLPKPPEFLFIDSIVNTEQATHYLPGATTALYTHARNIMQETATRLDTPVTYAFLTDHPKMVSWARIFGQRIFNWTIRFEDEEEYSAERVFYPAA